MRALRAIVLAFVVAIPLVATGQASPAATPPASCTGILVSAPGEPGSVAAVTREIHALLKELGLPPGAIDSYLAQQRGDTAACIEAFVAFFEQ
jgi:hypothetical protein